MRQQRPSLMCVCAVGAGVIIDVVCSIECDNAAGMHVYELICASNRAGTEDAKRRERDLKFMAIRSGVGA